MQRTSLITILLVAVGILAIFVGEASAQLAEAVTIPPQLGFSAMLAKMMPMFAMLFFIFYFMVLRPQNKKMLDHKKLIESLKKGDSVVTSGGIIGRVSNVEKDNVLVEVSNNVKIKFEPVHITRRVERAQSSASV